MVEIKKNLVSANKYNIKCPYDMTPQFIIVHNTANDASAENEINYMISNNNEVSYHYAVDDKEIVQGVPTNRNTWNAGDSGKGNGNRNGIAIEICYSKSGGERFMKAEQNASEFIASILKEKGWGIDKVKKHQDFNGKYCPHRTLDMGWDRFLNMVKSYLNSTPTTPTVNEGYLAKVTVDALNIREGAGTNYRIVGCIRDKGTYTIVETQNNWGKLKSGAGWICLDYTTKTTTTNKKSLDEVARAVIRGEYGNGAERKKRLEAEGYDPNEVQKRVNELL